MDTPETSEAKCQPREGQRERRTTWRLEIVALTTAVAKIESPVDGLNRGRGRTRKEIEALKDTTMEIQTTENRMGFKVERQGPTR